MKKIKPFFLSKKVFGYPYVLFMLIFVIMPLVLILVNAFLDTDGYLTLENFKTFFTEKSSLVVLGNSLLVGLITTVICLLIGYPVAYILSKYSSGKILVLLFVLPMWVNFLIRTLATKAVFVAMGVELGMGTVIFGMVYNYLPFMILPIYTTLSKISKPLIEASRDLGCSGFNVFRKVIFPLSIPGVITGITMVFVPAASVIVISTRLGGYRLVGDGIESYFKGAGANMNAGSMLSFVLMVIIVICMAIMNKFDNGEDSAIV